MSPRLRGTVAIAVAFAVPLLVLLASVHTAVGTWDTADLQTVAWIAGIPYPTGFPGYVIAGWLWTHLVPFASVAARLNALSALAIASGAATVTALALLLDVAVVLAVLAGWLFAFAHPMWLRAAYADAHPVGFAVAFVALALAARRALCGDERMLAPAIILGAVAVALDNTAVLILAGLVVVLLARRPHVATLARALALGAAIVAAAYAYLPLRSAQVVAQRLDPTLALGIAPGRPYWDDHDPRTPLGFVALVTGSEFDLGATFAQLPSAAALGGAWSTFAPDLEDDFPQGLLVVALAGWAFIVVRAPALGAGLAIAALLPALFGASYEAESDPWRYAFALYAILALAIAVAADRAVRAFTREGDAWVAPLVATALLAFALVHDLDRGADIVADRNDAGGEPLVRRVSAHTAPGTIVVADWVYASSLAYAAYVEGRFGRRIVVCAHPEDEQGRYRRWLRSRPVAIVSDDVSRIAGVRLRLVSRGEPNVWQVER